VTIREAAYLLGVSKETICKRVVRGTLPSEVGEDGRRHVYIEAGRDVAAAKVPTREHDVQTHTSQSLFTAKEQVRKAQAP
jgi:excisionase family DNA binding protein